MRAMAFRPVLEEVLVDAPGLPWTASRSPAGVAKVKWSQRAQVRLDLVGPPPASTPGTRPLGALLVGLVDAAAVAGLEADALVVVAHEAGDAAVADEQSDLVGRRAVADEVAERDRCSTRRSMSARIASSPGRLPCTSLKRAKGVSSVSVLNCGPFIDCVYIKSLTINLSM